MIFDDLQKANIETLKSHDKVAHEVISLVFGIPIFVEYFDTGLVPRFPTLIFSGFMLMISILTYVCGIILQVVVKKHRQLFELFLINTRKDK